MKALIIGGAGFVGGYLINELSANGFENKKVIFSDFHAPTEAINKLAENKSLREELGRNAQKRVFRNFNEKNIIKQLYGFLAEEVGE